MLDPLALQQPPDLDRPRRRVAAVGVGEQRHPVPERAPHRRHDRLGPPRPLVAVVADLGADPELEGVEPLLVAQPQHPRRLGLGRDVALHRRGVGPQPPRPPAEQLDHRLARPPPAQVPDRGVEAAHRPRQIGARKLVLALRHGVEQRVEVVAVLPEHPGRHLPVQHLRRDVGMVGRELAPALRPFRVRHPDEADEGGAEALDRHDPHGPIPSAREARLDAEACRPPAGRTGPFLTSEPRQSQCSRRP